MDTTNRGITLLCSCCDLPLAPLASCVHFALPLCQARCQAGIRSGKIVRQDDLRCRGIKIPFWLLIFPCIILNSKPASTGIDQTFNSTSLSTNTSISLSPFFPFISCRSLNISVSVCWSAQPPCTQLPTSFISAAGSY